MIAVSDVAFGLGMIALTVLFAVAVWWTNPERRSDTERPRTTTVEAFAELNARVRELIGTVLGALRIRGRR